MCSWEGDRGKVIIWKLTFWLLHSTVFQVSFKRRKEGFRVLTLRLCCQEERERTNDASEIIGLPQKWGLDPKSHSQKSPRNWKSGFGCFLRVETFSISNWDFWSLNPKSHFQKSHFSALLKLRLRRNKIYTAINKPQSYYKCNAVYCSKTTSTIQSIHRTVRTNERWQIYLDVPKQYYKWGAAINDNRNSSTTHPYPI